MKSVSRVVPRAACVVLMSSLAACGGGGSTSSSTAATTGTMPLVVSDASTEDWSVIGVKVLSIALKPQGGGASVNVYSSTSGDAINLAQLDQLGEILGNVSIPVGTYTGAVLTISANPGDVVLTASADPESGFAGTPGATVAASAIQVQHVHGTSGNFTTAVNVRFDSPLTITAGQNTGAIDLEVDLSHPAFIVGHVPATGTGNTVWAVNFEGPVRHHRVADITRLVLRHAYGMVTGIASDNTAITITKELPTLPVVSPETAVPTAQSLQILADATNGSLFYDVDAKAGPVTIKDFSTVAANLNGKFVRVAARYQSNGTLVATRIWASSNFNSVWVSPEGHVLHVDTSTNIIRVSNESGMSTPVQINANTRFYFRTPENALADATPIGTGTAFLASNVMRGFKVHVTVSDPLATPLVADSVDIETAAYDGKISAASATQFTYTRRFNTASDNYSVSLPYIDSASANGKDANGATIHGYKWWNFAFPTVVNSGASAISDFEAATTGSVNFGGTAGTLDAWGSTHAKWGDAANPTGWSAPWTVLVPTPVPLGTVATGLVSNGNTSSFSMNVKDGTQAVTVDLSTLSSAATLVYQVDRAGGVVTISPVDITTSAGLTALADGLTTGAVVKVSGVPQSDGTIKAYVLSYYTGTTQTAL